MRFTSGGNIGIGTTVPTDTLHISKVANHGITLSRPAGGSNPGSASIKVYSHGALVATSANNITYTSGGSNNHIFNRGSDESLRITSGGDVSISDDGSVHGVSKLTILPADRTSAFSASDGTTWHDVVLHQGGSATNNAVGLAFQLKNDGSYHANAGTGIAAVKNGTNSDYGADLVFITRPQSAVAEKTSHLINW